MKSISIESNGRIEKTAIYINSEQVAGIKEIFVNISEEGTFDAIMSYEGSDKKIYNKNIFEDYHENIRTREPSFTEEESRHLRLLTIESDGTLENAAVFLDEEMLEGLVHLLVHIKAGDLQQSSGIMGMFKSNESRVNTIFKAEATFRNEDDSLETERIF